MATHFVCDGCGSPVENPVKVGHIVKREYCPDCAKTADEYVDAEEAMRKKLHEQFIDRRAALIARYPNFRLPDCP